MDLENRIRLMAELDEFLGSEDSAWKDAKTKAFQHNAWFTTDFIDRAVQQIRLQFLQEEALSTWAASYELPAENMNPKKIGIVMAGNIPLVGFHDFLCCFMCGHHPYIKLSSKDPWLLPAMLNFLYEKEPALKQEIQTAPMLQGLDAYIATGSNNSARYFEYYFGRYPSLIRRNRTSVALLDGTETVSDLEKLSDDVFLYFGMGCRNVTQIHVPVKYDFVPLLNAFRKYQWMADHNKYKNNFDYRLSLAILNKQYYMTNDCVLLLEDESPFSPISVLHYTFRKDSGPAIPENLFESLQCVVGKNFLPFGQTQEPGLTDYADGADTMLFLRSL